MTDQKKAISTSYFSLIGNVLLAILKASAGFFGNSHALIADAIESATDVLSSFLILLGLKYANKPADKNHPYGHGKVEPLITFVVVAFLLASSMAIVYNSIQNLQTPQEKPEPWTLIVLLVIIIWKEISYRIVVKRSAEINSSALKADAWHHRSDAITSVVAFVGITIALLLGDGYEVADDWAAIFAAGFILYNAYLIFRPALGEVMDEDLYEDLAKKIAKISIEVEGILDTEKCFIRKSGMRYHVDLHAIVDGDISVTEGHHLSHLLKDRLKKEITSIENVLVHIEPNISEIL